MGQAGSPRAYEVAVAWIEERILGGDLGVGAMLPAERDLAAQLGVSRSAVREAVRTLQAQGVLRSSVGAGGTGGTRVASLSSGALSRMLRMHVALEHYPLEDVTEVRVALERLSVRLAAAGATEAQRETLRVRLVDLQTAQNRVDFNDADSAFHVAIAEAAGNRLAAETTIAIRESVRGPLLAGLARMRDADFEHLAGELNDEHAEILAAIEAGDVAGAERLMEHHVRTAWTRIQAALSVLPPAAPSPPEITMGA